MAFVWYLFCFIVQPIRTKSLVAQSSASRIQITAYQTAENNTSTLRLNINATNSAERILSDSPQPDESIHQQGLSWLSELYPGGTPSPQEPYFQGYQKAEGLCNVPGSDDRQDQARKCYGYSNNPVRVMFLPFLTRLLMYLY